jgi:hypothetical protein
MVDLFAFAGHSNKDCRWSNGMNSFESDGFCARSGMLVDHKHTFFLGHGAGSALDGVSILQNMHTSLQGECARGPRTA